MGRRITGLLPIGPRASSTRAWGEPTRRALPRDFAPAGKWFPPFRADVARRDAWPVGVPREGRTKDPTGAALAPGPGPRTGQALSSPADSRNVAARLAPGRMP